MSDRETQQRGVDFKIEGAVEASAAKGDASSERVAEQGVRVGSIPTPAPAPSHTSPSDRETQQRRSHCVYCGSRTYFGRHTCEAHKPLFTLDPNYKGVHNGRYARSSSRQSEH